MSHPWEKREEDEMDVRLSIDLRLPMDEEMKNFLLNYEDFPPIDDPWIDEMFERIADLILKKISSTPRKDFEKEFDPAFHRIGFNATSHKNKSVDFPDGYWPE